MSALSPLFKIFIIGAIRLILTGHVFKRDMGSWEVGVFFGYPLCWMGKLKFNIHTDDPLHEFCVDDARPIRAHFTGVKGGWQFESWHVSP